MGIKSSLAPRWTVHHHPRRPAVRARCRWPGRVRCEQAVVRLDAWDGDQQPAALVPALAVPEHPSPGALLVGVAGLSARIISACTQNARAPRPLLSRVLHALSVAAAQQPGEPQ